MALSRIFAALLGFLLLPCAAALAQTPDWITGLPRTPVHLKAWPNGKKVAVCFVFYVEVWGKDHGPNFRSDMNGRSPDVVDEAFRQYAIEEGVPRVGRCTGNWALRAMLKVKPCSLNRRPTR